MPNSKRYFVFSDNRYLRIDTTALCVYEYIYNDEFEMLYLYCCIDTQIVFGDVGVGFFSIEQIYYDRLLVIHDTFQYERYELLRNWGIFSYILQKEALLLKCI